MEETKWIKCPECGEKTRVKIKKTTIMKDFLLFCHHCKKEFTVDVEDFAEKVMCQHYIISYGDNTKLIKDFCKIAGIEIM